MTAPLSSTVPALAPNVGALRRALRRWLGDVLDDPDAVDDLVLATSEALENAVDHAFVDSSAVGTMTMTAVDDGASVTVVVSDDGQWQVPDPTERHRGRGIDLIRRLADASIARPSAGGTVVTLVHHRVPVSR